MSTDIENIEKDVEIKEENVRQTEVKESKPVTKLDEIKNQFDNIDSEYESQYPVIDLTTFPQYKSEAMPGYEEIKEEAKKELEAYKNINENKIIKDFETDMVALDNKQDKIYENLRRDTLELERDYIHTTEQNRANQIEQGIERSSIADNIKEGTDALFDENLKNLRDDAMRDIEELELKRTVIRNEMTNALEEFNIAYASELEDKIAELNKEYNDKTLEVEKYNKKIAELRNKRLDEWQEWSDKISNEINAKKGYEKTVYIIGQLQSLSKAEALQILKDREVIASLGSWYSAVIDYVNRYF